MQTTPDFVALAQTAHTAMGHDVNVQLRATAPVGLGSGELSPAQHLAAATAAVNRTKRVFNGVLETLGVNGVLGHAPTSFDDAGRPIEPRMEPIVRLSARAYLMLTEPGDRPVALERHLERLYHRALAHELARVEAEAAR